MLLVSAFGASSSVGSDVAREKSHHFTWGADIVLFSMLIGYMAFNAPRNENSFLIKRGPLMLTLTGCILMLVDPSRHVLLDHDGVFFKPESLAMFDDAGNLSAAGRFGRSCTISGLICLVSGVAWFMKLPAMCYRLASSSQADS